MKTDFTTRRVLLCVASAKTMNPVIKKRENAEMDANLISNVLCVRVFEIISTAFKANNCLLKHGFIINMHTVLYVIFT